MIHPYISEEIQNYDATYDGDDDPFANDDTTDTVKILISVYYHYHVATTNDDPEGLGLIDKIHAKCCHHLGYDGVAFDLQPREISRRTGLCHTAKKLIREGRISYVEALMMLFTKDDLECYGY